MTICWEAGVAKHSVLERIQLLGRSGIDVIEAMGRSGVTLLHVLFGRRGAGTGWHLLVRQLYFVGV